MRPPFEIATEKLLRRPVLGAALVKYPGWFQEEAIKKQFRGPLIPLRAVTSGIGRRQRDEVRALLADAGLPDIAVLAITQDGVQVVRASLSPLTGAAKPEECVQTLSPGTFAASSEQQTFTVLLTLVLPDGQRVQYECSRFGLGMSSVKAVERIVASGGGHPGESLPVPPALGSDHRRNIMG